MAIKNYQGTWIPSAVAQAQLNTVLPEEDIHKLQKLFDDWREETILPQIELARQNKAKEIFKDLDKCCNKEAKGAYVELTKYELQELHKKHLGDEA